MPNIPDIKPEISVSRDDAVNVLLSSIGMEELSLAHILNAEAEKIQFTLGTLEGSKNCPSDMETILKVNEQSAKTLRDVIKNQMLLSMKLEDIITLLPPIDHNHCHPNNFPPCQHQNDCGDFNPCNPCDPCSPCYGDQQDRNDCSQTDYQSPYSTEEKSRPNYTDLAQKSAEFGERINKQYYNHGYQDDNYSNLQYPTMQHHTVEQDDSCSPLEQQNIDEK